MKKKQHWDIKYRKHSLLLILWRCKSKDREYANRACTVQWEGKRCLKLILRRLCRKLLVDWNSNRNNRTMAQFFVGDKMSFICRERIWRDSLVLVTQHFSLDLFNQNGEHLAIWLPNWPSGLGIFTHLKWKRHLNIPLPRKFKRGKTLKHAKTSLFQPTTHTPDSTDFVSSEQKI